jgi:hypothetical protein
MKVRWALAASVAIATLAACSSSLGASEPRTSLGHSIVYRLSGSAHRVNVTLRLNGPEPAKQEIVSLPLTSKTGSPGLRFIAGHGEPLYLSAQNDGSGTMHCSITENGRTISSNTSSGQYATVTCSGSA